MKKFLISSSILSADFSCLGQEINKVVSAGSDMIHFDVMDNHYVPNLTLGPMVLKSLREYGILVPIEVHLMASPVDRLITQFSKVGANCIIFHPETSSDIYRSLKLIKLNGCKSGLALNPSMSLNRIKEFIDIIDVILIMSVNPGFSGQSFIYSTYKKILDTRKFIKNKKSNIRLEVDGGIKTSNIRSIFFSGADVFIIGSEIFGSKNYFQTIKLLKNQIYMSFR